MLCAAIEVIQALAHGDLDQSLLKIQRHSPQADIQEKQEQAPQELKALATPGKPAEVS